MSAQGLDEKKIAAFQNGTNVAIWLGGAVYSGGVLLYLAFYVSLMSSQFSGLMQIIAVIGAGFVAANALALPIALHFWSVSGGHRASAILFYIGDILLMGLNIISSNAARAGTIAQTPWLASYVTYAPASVVFVIVTWAVLYMTDPGQRSLVRLQDALNNSMVTIIDKVQEHVQSDEGLQTIIAPAAMEITKRLFNNRKLIGLANSIKVDETQTGAQITLSEEYIDAIADRLAVKFNPGVVVPDPQSKADETQTGAQITLSEEYIDAIADRLAVKFNPGVVVPDPQSKAIVSEVDSKSAPFHGS